MLVEMLSHADQIRVVSALEALTTVQRPDELVDCVRATVHPLLPHETFVFGAGTVKGQGFTDYVPVGYRFPLPFLDDMRQPDGTIATPAIARWLTSGEPELFDGAAHRRATSGAKKPWVEAFDRYALENMAAHGVVDRAHKSATFFSFFQISARLGDHQKRVLSLLAPHLHVALQRCVAAVRPTSSGSSGAALTPKQREVAKYLALGKTNWEIAQILGCSERNAKYHVEEIIRRLDVVNRTEAVARATALGLL